MGTILQSIIPSDQSSTAQLEIADSLWGQSGFPFLDAFRQLTHDSYDADFNEADFHHAPEDAKNAINDWVRTATHDMIPKLFDQLLSHTRLVLSNALYFKSFFFNDTATTEIYTLSLHDALPI